MREAIREDTMIKLNLPGNQYIHLTPAENGSASMGSNLHEDPGVPGAATYNAAIDGLEALMMAQHCAGIDVTEPKYAEAVATALEAIANHY